MIFTLTFILHTFILLFRLTCCNFHKCQTAKPVKYKFEKFFLLPFLKVGVRDYERFTKELHSLSHLSEEAEKVLKEPDLIGSPDISSVLEHMEKLKVKIVDLFP